MRSDVGLRRPVEDAFTYVAEIDGGFAGYCFVAAPSREPELGPDVAGARRRSTSTPSAGVRVQERH